MKRRRLQSWHLFALVLLAAVVLSHRAGVFRGLQTKRPELPDSHRYACQLVQVLDGDTIVVRWRGRKEDVRLLRINTPERGQPGCEESADFLRNLISGEPIELEFEEGDTFKKDRYGRLLAYVLTDGKNANVEIVRAGWSPFWTTYGQGRYAEAFEEAESEAKRNKRGLWREKEATGSPRT